MQNGQKSDNDKIKSMQLGIKKAFDSVKEELNDHLNGINYNSEEIQGLYERISELDSKIEKLNERLDEISMLTMPAVEQKNLDIQLTHREQEVFVVLYAEERLTAKEIARRLGFTDEMVNRYAYNMISKGVPVLRQYQNGEMYLSIDLKFKTLQMKKNILKIDESISKQLLDDKAL